MNYAEPRQVAPTADRPDAGKWRWTVRNDDIIRADGYCAAWEPCPASLDDPLHALRDNAPKCATCGGRGIVDKADPCPGHDTAEKAAEHFRQYQIDNAKFVVVPDEDASQLHRCGVEACSTFTASYMRIEGDGYRHDVVCPAHHTDDTKRALIGLTMERIYS